MASIKSVSWKDIRAEVRTKNLEIAAIIDEIDPDDSFKLYVGTYSYGEYIVKDGVFVFPPIIESTSLNELKSELGYNYAANPVSLILQNTLEIFYIINQCSIPFLYGLVAPGSIMSTWKVISDPEAHTPAFLWDVVSGARSLFMLSKISDTAGNKRLKKHFNLLTTNKPKTFLSQWEIFREILAHESINKKWETKILFFGKKWFEKINNARFKELHLYLLKKAWRGSNYFRNQFIWDLIYSIIQERKNIKAEAYIINTVKHLITVAIGMSPGFVPAIDDYAGPITLLQDIYRDIYQLKTYEPIFMHLHNFKLTDDRSIYYSLEYPTTPNFSVRSTEETSKIQDLINIKSIMAKFLDEIKKGDLNIYHTSIFELVNNVSFDYFHSIKGFHQINNIDKLVELDLHLKKFIEHDSNKFPWHSSFLKGCIKISSLQKKVVSV